jgi:hypothetical protein
VCDGNTLEVDTETGDPNDDYLVALARAHNLDAIVSGGMDLLEWEEQRPSDMASAQFEERGGTTPHNFAPKSGPAAQSTRTYQPESLGFKTYGVVGLEVASRWRRAAAKSRSSADENTVTPAAIPAARWTAS